MPVEFLSDAEASAYGRFSGAPLRVELERVFFLDDVDRALVDRRRGAHNRLGFALQMFMGKTRHKSPRTAMRYVNPGPAAVAEVTELLNPPKRTH